MTDLNLTSPSPHILTGFNLLYRFFLHHDGEASRVKK